MLYLSLELKCAWYIDFLSIFGAIGPKHDSPSNHLPPKTHETGPQPHQAENRKVVVKFDLSNKGHFILPVNNGNAWVNSRGIQWPQNPFILMVLRWSWGCWCILYFFHPSHKSYIELSIFYHIRLEPYIHFYAH